MSCVCGREVVVRNVRRDQTADTWQCALQARLRIAWALLEGLTLWPLPLCSSVATPSAIFELFLNVCQLKCADAAVAMHTAPGADMYRKCTATHTCLTSFSFSTFFGLGLLHRRAVPAWAVMT
eukprot:357693-Chlamydomonas_euryale.AAC.2